MHTFGDSCCYSLLNWLAVKAQREVACSLSILPYPAINSGIPNTSTQRERLHFPDFSPRSWKTTRVSSRRQEPWQPKVPLPAIIFSFSDDLTTGQWASRERTRCSLNSIHRPRSSLPQKIKWILIYQGRMMLSASVPAMGPAYRFISRAGSPPFSPLLRILYSSPHPGDSMFSAYKFLARCPHGRSVKARN